MWTAGPAPAPVDSVPLPVSLRSMTVAARFGVTGVRVPAASARMRSGHSGGYH